MFYIYRYTYRGEVIYIGKTSRELYKRIEEHKSESKFVPYLAESVVDFFTTATSVEMDIYEKYYINIYSPRLNVVDMCGADFNFRLPEPHWQKFDEHIAATGKQQFAATQKAKKQAKQGNPARRQELETKLAELETAYSLLDNFEALLDTLFEAYVSEDFDEVDTVVYRWDMESYPLPDVIKIDGISYGCFTASRKCGCCMYENRMPAKTLRVFLKGGRGYVSKESLHLRQQILDIEYEIEKLS